VRSKADETGSLIYRTAPKRKK